MDKFIVCFVRIVYVAGVLTTVVMTSVGVLLLVYPALLVNALRIAAGIACIGITLLSAIVCMIQKALHPEG